MSLKNKLRNLEVKGPYLHLKMRVAMRVVWSSVEHQFTPQMKWELLGSNVGRW